MADRRNKMLQAQFKKATAIPDHCIKIWMDDTNKSHWYVIIGNIAGNQDEYVGGEYLVRFEIPNDFPFSPPHFYLMTPNGVYETEVKVCVSIGEFHKENYRAVLGIDGFAANLMSGIVGWETLGSGISIIKTTIEKKRQLAKASVAFNRANHARIIAAVEESYTDYKAVYDVKQA